LGGGLQRHFDPNREVGLVRPTLTAMSDRWVQLHRSEGDTEIIACRDSWYDRAATVMRSWNCRRKTL